MSNDIIGRAENLSKSWHRTQPGLTNVLDELISELKATRAEIRQLREHLPETPAEAYARGYANAEERVLNEWIRQDAP